MLRTSFLCIAIIIVGIASTSPVAVSAQLPSPACVMFPAESKNVSSGSRGSGSVEYSCTWDASAIALTCANKGGMMKVTTVTAYKSIGDAVDTVAAIPPLTKSTSLKQSGAGPGSTTVYTYDGQKRLTREVATTSIVTVTTEYSDWDSHGRPRKARKTTTPGNRPPDDQTITYDDAARTKTIKTMQNGSLTSTDVITFDTNGNQVKATRTDDKGSSTSTTTISSTIKVCR